MSLCAIKKYGKMHTRHGAFNMLWRKWEEKNLIMAVCERRRWPEATWCWIMNKKSFSFISCFFFLAISSINSNICFHERRNNNISMGSSKRSREQTLLKSSRRKKMVFWWSFHSLNFSFYSCYAYKSYLFSWNYYIFSGAMLTEEKHVEDDERETSAHSRSFFKSISLR